MRLNGSPGEFFALCSNIVLHYMAAEGNGIFELLKLQDILSKSLQYQK